MAIIYQPGMDPSRVYYGTDTRAFALLIGAALALVWPSRRLSADLPPRRRLFLDAVGGGALLAMLFMIWHSNQYQTSLYYGGLFFFAILSAVLVAVLAHPASWLGRLFGMQPLRWLGVCSYGIYLWHYPVIILTSPGLNTGGQNVALAIEQTVLTIILAAVSWYFIEAPICHGKCKEHWERLSSVLKRRPKLLEAQGKATLLSIIFILFVFVSVLSGCSLISHAQQQGSLPRTAGKTEKVNQTEKADKAQQVNKREQTTNPAETKVQESKDHKTGSQAGTGAANQDPDKNDVLTGKGVTAIGDSVMVEVGPALQKLFPGMVVDGKIGRQMYQAPQVLKNLKDQGMLGNTVIMELGANGVFTEKQFADILELLGNDRQIVLINTRVPKPWESVVNRLLSQAAEDNSNIQLVDWYTASSGHNEYFNSDGVHLKQAGVEAYVSLVADAVNP
jgi:hypothetical protein